MSGTALELTLLILTGMFGAGTLIAVFKRMKGWLGSLQSACSRPGPDCYVAALLAVKDRAMFGARISHSGDGTRFASMTNAADDANAQPGEAPRNIVITNWFPAMIARLGEDHR